MVQRKLITRDLQRLELAFVAFEAKCICVRCHLSYFQKVSSHLNEDRSEKIYTSKMSAILFLCPEIGHNIPAMHSCILQNFLILERGNVSKKYIHHNFHQLTPHKVPYNNTKCLRYVQNQYINNCNYYYMEFFTENQNTNSAKYTYYFTAYSIK